MSPADAETGQRGYPLTGTAARMTLLASTGALILLFGVGFDPVNLKNVPADGRPWPISYGAALLATAAATLCRMALTPLVGADAVPFITFFPAVLFSAWYGGFRVASFSILTSVVAAAYYFLPPFHTLQLRSPGDRIMLVIFLVAGFGMALLSRSQRGALELANRETSRRRGAELAERAERRRFEVTLASIGDAVIATDASGRVSFMNAVAESLTGWNLEQASGKPLHSVVRLVNEGTRLPAENPAIRAMQDGCIAGLTNPVVLISKDGSEIAIDGTGSPIKGLEETVIGSVLIFRDIRERRRMEVERADAERISRRLAAMVESCDDAIIGKDLELQVTSWNRAAEQMFGYSAAEVIGQALRLIIPENRLEEEAQLMDSIRRGERLEHIETERRCKDGRIIPMSLTISPIRDSHGVVVGASTIARDITESRRAAEAERQARQAAEEANRAKDMFLAMLSHDLRTPLTSILGWAAILKGQPMSTERASHAVEVIERNARIEANLVESVLDLSRSTSGKLTLEKERVDLCVVIESIADSLQPVVYEKGVALTVATPAEPVFLVADPNRIQQVFSNLMTNSIKYTPRGGSVHVQVGRVGSIAQVRVTDNGAGIPPDLLPRVFEPFRQTENGQNRNDGGLGLGLAIVRELVRAHDGDVVAESSGEGQGATFSVTLPMARAS